MDDCRYDRACQNAVGQERGLTEALHSSNYHPVLRLTMSILMYIAQWSDLWMEDEGPSPGGWRASG